MTLRELLSSVETLSVSGDLETPITSVTSDSRLASAGSLFVAVPGFQFDGATFIDGAVRKGAAAIVTEVHGLGLPVPTIEVANARTALAEISANFHGRPADRLSLIGVTGTSGKTTTTKMIESILEQTGEPVGLIGTIEYRAGDRREIADRTTPDATVLQQWFANMVAARVRRAVMEISSHALALRRTHGIRFSVAVFTNLSRDHFDFHRDFEDYFATKKMLFDQIDRSKQCAVVNRDDDHGRRLAFELGKTVMTFGRGAECDIHPASGFAPALDGLRGVLATPAGEIRIESPLVGTPNLYNWMGAVGAAIAAGVPAAAIENGARALSSVRGRFESVPSPDGPSVLIDYAHKPDALEKLLHAVRSLAAGRRVILVFGCGGDRDTGKRPEMGAIAGRLADLSILTSDNPRSESPEAIVRAIEVGIETIEGAKWEVIVDRRDAIARAIEVAGRDDVVVIAGKGHENYQVIGDRVVHFDDREEVESVLKNRKKSR